MFVFGTLLYPSDYDGQLAFERKSSNETAHFALHSLGTGMLTSESNGVLHENVESKSAYKPYWNSCMPPLYSGEVVRDCAYIEDL